VDQKSTRTSDESELPANLEESEIKVHFLINFDEKRPLEDFKREIFQEFEKHSIYESGIRA
jgi:hypothetical protein